MFFFFFFQAEDGIRDYKVTGVQTCALPIFWQNQQTGAQLMCGIAGILNLTEDELIREEVVRQMLAMIRHRGPDQFGIYSGGQVALGNARLSIIDLQTGQQPISNEDGSLWIVYNGEIFNYLELRVEL